MSDKENGGPAFPCETIAEDESGEYRTPYQGMTLRDYFAAKAMQEMLGGNYQFMTQIARDAYIMADAMLEARK